MPVYLNLDEYLAASPDLANGLEHLDDLGDLARELGWNTVNAHMLGRAPDVLDPEQPERFVLFLTALDGVAAEVTAIAGPTPTGTARSLALRAMGLGVARDLEESLFPEQQLGDDSRAEYLRRRYEEVLGMLRALNPGTGLSTSPLGPVGTFPAARGYPDPAERCTW